MPVNDEVLTVGIELDIRQAIRQTRQFQQAMNKAMSQVSKAVDGLGKANSKMAKDAAKGTKEQVTQFHNLEKSIASASKRGKGGIIDSKALAKDASAGLMKAAEGFKGSLSSFFQKDAKGMVQNLGNTLKGALSGAVRGSAAASLKAGGTMGRAGAGMSARGRARGGVTGGAMRAGGGMMKAGGKGMAAMGKGLAGIAKMGPIFAMLGTAIMKIVEVFIDAEAQAKRFQRTLLQSASTIEYMGANAWNTNKAFGEMNYVIKEIREAAMDLDNIGWGITSEEHLQVLNTLTQAGVSMHRLGQEAVRSGKGVKTFAKELTQVSVAYSRAFGLPLQEINQLQAEMMTDLGMSAEETKLGFAQMARSASESGIAANKFFSIIRGASQDLSLYNLRMADAVKTLKMLGKVMSPRTAEKFFQSATKGLKDMGRQQLVQLTMLAGPGNAAEIVQRDLDSKYKDIAKKLNMDASRVAEIIKSEGVEGLAFQINQLPEEMQGAAREMAINAELQQTRSEKGMYGTATALAGVGPGGALEAMELALGRIGGTGDLRQDVGSIGPEEMAEKLGKSIEEVNQMVAFRMAIDMERSEMAALLQKQIDTPNKLSEEEKARLKEIEDAGLTAANINEAGYQQIYDGMSEDQKEAHKDADKVINYAKRQTELTSDVMKKLEALLEFIMNQLYNVMLDIWEGLIGILSTFDLPDWLGGGKSLAQKQKERLQAARGVASQKGESREQDVKDLQSITSAAGEKDINTALWDTKLGKNMQRFVREDWVSEVAAVEQAQADLQNKYPGTDSVAAAEALGLKEIAKGMRMQPGEEGYVDPSWSDETVKKMTDALAKEHAAAVRGKGWQLAALASINQQANVVTDKEDLIRRASGGQAYKKDPIENFEDKLANAMKLMGGGQDYHQALEESFSPKEFGRLMGETLYQLSPEQVGAAAKDFSVETTKVEQDYLKTLEGMKADGADTSKEIAAFHKAATSGNTLSVKFPKSFLTGPYAKTIEEAVLDSVRTALFEYYLYSGLDPDDMVEQMSARGSTPAAMAAEAARLAEYEGRTIGSAWGIDEAEEPDGGQTGGTFTRGGLAMLHGGEYVVPRHGAPIPGGGGGGVQRVEIAFRGDAGRLFQQAVTNAQYENRRRERTT